MSNKWNIPLALNTIFYGPPGTGKTHTLVKNLAEQYFTLKKNKQHDADKEPKGKQELLNKFLYDVKFDDIHKWPWWKVAAIAILDIGHPATWPEIMDNDLVKQKSKIMKSELPRKTLQTQLGMHCVPDDSIRTQRSGNPIFTHRPGGIWDVDRELAREKCKELFDFHDKYKKIMKDEKTGQQQEIKRYEFVTFHQSFSYENFVEGISAKTDEETHQIIYSIEPGIFKRFCELARQTPDEPYALFIDEINRGNVSSIFGELIALIEENKREGAEEEMRVKLPYSGENFTVPANLFIIGAMNTADRSIDVLDSALKRRFSFIEMPSRPELLAQNEFKPNHLDINLKELLESMNDRIEFLLDRDHRIGHSYFMKIQDASREQELANLRSAFKDQIIPLLEDYFYGDLNKVALVLGEKFFTKNILDSSCLLATNDDTSALSEKTIRTLVDISTLTEDDFKSLIRQ